MQDDDDDDEELGNDEEAAAATAAFDALASCAATVQESHKDWSTALSRFSKAVDKVN